MAEKQPYYADGRRVYKAPVEAENSDGTKTVSMGFPVCDVHEACIDDAARVIADALNNNPAQNREPLAGGREHLTVSGTFQSDRYPWCAAGFVPLKVTDPQALPALVLYAELHAGAAKHGDSAFARDLVEALVRQHGVTLVDRAHVATVPALVALQEADETRWPMAPLGARPVDDVLGNSRQRTEGAAS